MPAAAHGLSVEIIQAKELTLIIVIPSSFELLPPSHAKVHPEVDCDMLVQNILDIVDGRCLSHVPGRYSLICD
jgi:hypothetical protein